MINIKYSYNGRKNCDIEQLKNEIRTERNRLVTEAKFAYRILKNQFEAKEITEEEFKQQSKAVLSEYKSLISIQEKRIQFSFKRKTFLEVDSSEFNNTEIVGSCFAQENPRTDVFPPDMIGVTFQACNLENCNIPPGNTVIGKNDHVKEQNDREYWYVDIDGNPIAPRNPEKFDRFGISKNPNDIPAQRMKEAITVKNDPKVIAGKKIMELSNDHQRLREILIEKGEL